MHDMRIIKGLESKNKIYSCTKKEFYEQGYRRSTIQHITAEAGVPLGLFTYYFKTKDNVVELIYTDFMNQIRKALEAFEWYNEDTSFFKNTCIYFVFYESVLQDPNTARFFYEVIQKDFKGRLLHDWLTEAYRTYLADYRIKMKENEFTMLLSFDFGGRREIFLNYFNKKLNVSQQKLIHMVTMVVPRYMQIPKKEIDRVYKKVYSNLGQVDISSFNMLK